MTYQIYATMCAFYVPTAIILAVNYKIYTAARRLQLDDRRQTVEFENTAVVNNRYKCGEQP
jgi:5-hydroxytryptamine receptor 7